MGEPETLNWACAPLKEEWAHRRADGRIQARTEAMYVRLLGTFVAYAAARGVTGLAGLTQQLCVAWVHAPVSADSPGSRARAGDPASMATRKNRCTVLREATRYWADQRWIGPEVIPPVVRSGDMPPRPCLLSPPDVRRLRLGGRMSAVDTHHPTLIELGLAGVYRSAMARIAITDVDPGGVIHLTAVGKFPARAITLSAQAATVVNAHVAARTRTAAKRGWQPENTPLVLRSPFEHYAPDSLPITLAQDVRRAMTTAGVLHPGVRPNSLLDYAANYEYALTNRVEDVADVLGLRSLDAARDRIDPHWQARWADTLREQQA